MSNSEPRLKNHVSVRLALQRLSQNLEPSSPDVGEVPMWEHICRELYVIANSSDGRITGSTARANRARKIIFDKLVGRRRAGSLPATRVNESLEMGDLTKGSVTM